MKEQIWDTPTSTTRIHRDAHDKSGKYTFETIEQDGHILKRNEQIRSSRLMKSGQYIPVMGDTVEIAFSIPPVQFSRIKKDLPDVWALIQSNDIEDQKKGGRQLALLHPEWVMTTGHK